MDQLSALGWNVSFNQQSLNDVRELANQTDDSDIGKIHKPRTVSAVNERVADDVAAIQERGALPLTLGGDHSLVSQSTIRNARGTCVDWRNVGGVWIRNLRSPSGARSELFL